MAQFKPNVPVVQKESQVKVDINPDTPLSVGKYRFQLVVVDDSGNESKPAFIDIIVRDTDVPTAVLDLLNDAGAIDTSNMVSAGKSFILSGTRSKDSPPGKVVEYRFMLLDPVA